MADQRQSLPFEPKASPKVQGQSAKQRRSQQSVRQEAIPKPVANRMARRVAVFTGLPSLAGMGVFVLSYVLMTRGIAEIAPGVTLAASGFFFLLGLAGLFETPGLFGAPGLLGFTCLLVISGLLV